MAQRRGEDVREWRLEGAGLFLIVAFLVAALVGSFFLGRWYERSSAPPAGLADLQNDPLENVVAPEELETVDESATHFDRVGGAVEEEPTRQATPPPERTEEPSAEEAAPAQPAGAEPAPSAGDFYVQIAALRDRRSAERIVTELGDLGYPVRLFSESEGSGRLYRVRVGGYATREEADRVADELKGKGHPGAFAVELD